MINKRNTPCRKRKIVYNLREIDYKAICSLIDPTQLPELRFYFSLHILSHLTEAINNNRPVVEIEDILIR
jgi:hypothetical protein